nr:CHAT domain-containing protein [Pirellula sp.]
NWRAKLQETVLFVRQGLSATHTPLETSLEDFRKVLIPDDKWNQLLESTRWVIVPDDDLWLFPFELLQEGSSTSKAPVIANHPITYLPTLGSAQLLMQNKPSQDRATAIQTQGFLASKPDSQKSVSNRIAGMSNTFVLDTSGVQTAIPSRLLKIISPVMVSFIKTSWSDPNNIVLGIDSALNESTLAGWNQLPWGAPKHVWLMGAEFRPDAISSTGDAWRKLILSLAAQGTEQMIISRWCVGGESASILAEALRDYGGSIAWSEAWQRAVANLWAEELGGAREVTLAKDADPSSPISGELPLYWSGYIVIGDSRE